MKNKLQELINTNSEFIKFNKDMISLVKARIIRLENDSDVLNTDYFKRQIIRDKNNIQELEQEITEYVNQIEEYKKLLKEV